MNDTRHDTKHAINPGLLPYAHNIGSPPIRPTSEGVIRGKALKSMEEQIKKQFSQIQEQYELIAKQALELKRRSDISYLIYESKIMFEPIIGETYYLYHKDLGNFISMIEPQNWSNPTIEWLATVKLLSDYTWDVLKTSENYQDYFNI
jgi:hypothetical protein